MNPNPVIETLEKYENRITSCNFLNNAQNTPLSYEQLQIFLKQRYLAALVFEDLIQSAIEKTTILKNSCANSKLKQAYCNLQANLESNLKEERGEFQDTTHPDYSKEAHDVWRKNFYAEFKLSNQELEKSKLRQKEWLIGTEFYNNACQELCEKNALQIAGALCLLEKTIPLEFTKIARLLVKSQEKQPNIPKIFYFEKEKLCIVKGKEKQATYIYDHIIHDARHYVELLNPLVEIYSASNEFQKENVLTEIQKGCEQITKAKEQFYKSMQLEVVG